MSVIGNIAAIRMIAIRSITTAVGSAAVTTAIGSTTVTTTVTTTIRSAVATTPATTVAHAMLTPIPRTEAAVAIRAKPKSTGGLHRYSGSANDQGSGESLRY
uniref:Uncharacterized protein n=1 Tax=Candidatus Kentrum sp. UNK TaxID=2126344 RepID=A0A451B420_9GAMM|nr:MAG: hypothetical protein BECKUNK1418G_GA0071005_11802 [Candidatus Kentron sp. UNK]VFK73032.1 MAG: hypothetical protein BECKUNK1418H_GA0071006_11583 [Candidatus Kentron sp. UNK]